MATDPNADPSTDPNADWIASAIRPFDENPELRLAARQELVERAPDADPAQLATLAARFDAIDRASPRKQTLLHWLPIALAFVLTLGIAIPGGLHYIGVRDFFASVGMMGPPAKSQSDLLGSELTPENHFALFGDTSQPTPELAIKALWESDPESPLLYNYYLNHCDPYPDDMLETAERIDPDNGWFLLMAAGTHAEEAVEKTSRPWSGPREKRPVVKDWKIKDAEKLQQALDLIERAAARPRIEYYGAEHLRQRLEILPPERDFRSRTIRMIHAASSNTGDCFKAMRCSDLLSAHIWSLGQTKDTDALRDVIPLVGNLTNQLNQQEGFLVNQLVTQAICRTLYEHLLEACEHSGMTEEANRIRPVVEQLRAAHEAQRGRGSDYTDTDYIRRHAGLIAGMTSLQFTRFGITPPTLDEMTPGRRADYALVDRAGLWAAAALLLLAILAALPLPYFRGALPGRLGRRFALLLGPADWLWILVLGTALPLLWLLAITRLTPLGCRDWSLGFLVFQPVSTQYTFAFFLLIATTLCAIRWRLGKHAGSLGFGPRRPLRSLLPALLIALAIPLAGTIRYSLSMAIFGTAIAIAGIATAWLLFLVCRSLFGSRRHSPYRAAVARLLPRAFAFSALILIALLPFTILSERHWIAHDELGRTSSENLGMGRLELEATRALRATLQTALDAQPE